MFQRRIWIPGRMSPIDRLNARIGAQIECRGHGEESGTELVIGFLSRRIRSMVVMFARAIRMKWLRSSGIVIVHVFVMDRIFHINHRFVFTAKPAAKLEKKSGFSKNGCGR